MFPLPFHTHTPSTHTCLASAFTLRRQSNSTHSPAPCLCLTWVCCYTFSSFPSTSLASLIVLTSTFAPLCPLLLRLYYASLVLTSSPLLWLSPFTILVFFSSLSLCVCSVFCIFLLPHLFQLSLTRVLYPSPLFSPDVFSSLFFCLAQPPVAFAIPQPLSPSSEHSYQPFLYSFFVFIYFFTS